MAPELTFADTELDAKATRDPVAPARRSASARRKAATATLDDGTIVARCAGLTVVMDAPGARIDFGLSVVRFRKRRIANTAGGNGGFLHLA